MFSSLINFLVLLLVLLLHVVYCLPVQKEVTEVDINARKSISSESFHGDIVLTKEQKKAFELARGRRQSMNSLSTNSVMSTAERLWPNKTVYYNITASARDEKTYRAIMEAISQFRRKSCLKFLERTTQPDYVFFTKGTGCYSNVGRIGGPQAISIGAGCERPGIVMHEIFHALGRWHEQNRPDRDDFVSIHLENVNKKYHNNFAKLSFVKTYNIPYDLLSLMHYPANAFSKNGHPSIVPVVPTNAQLGQRERFTSSDLEYLNRLYDCDNEENAVWSAWSSWSSCSASCGEGQRTRSRTCQGNGCQATEQREALPCSTQKCRDPSWTQWSSCSRTCEGGVQTRWQMCQEGINCPEELMTRSCNTNVPCSTKPVPPTDRGLWGEWSECTKPCGGGIKTRRKECGVDNCHTETVPCNTQACSPEQQVQQHIGCFIVPNDRNSPLRSLEELAPDILFGNPAQRSEPVKKCRKVAEQYKFTLFGVALGYCISGSNNLAEYTTIVAPSNSCSNGKGGYQSSPTNEFYMDVYKLLDENVQHHNSTNLLPPAKLATSTIPIIPELTNSTSVLAANSFIILITLLSLLI